MSVKPDSETLWLPYLPCPACGHPSKEQFHVDGTAFTTRFICGACDFDMFAGSEGYPTTDHRVEFINRLDITIFTLQQYIFDGSHGDVLVREPVGDIMVQLGEVLQRQLGR